MEEKYDGERKGGEMENQEGGEHDTRYKERDEGKEGERDKQVTKKYTQVRDPKGI